MTSEEQKAKKREDRFNREVQKFNENIAIPRPGTSGVQITDLPALDKHGIELSDILYLTLADLRDNPLNEYSPLPDDELAELTEDIRQKGILIALIVKQDGTIVCGHNRKRAGIAAGLVRGPAQQILSELTPDLERDIMKSENDRRRGGQWSKERKEKFIRENFGDEIHVDKRGGDRKSQNFNEGLKESQSLATRIEKQSRGKIAKGTADRLIADLRKKTPKKPDSGSASLPAKERRRAEKLAVQIRTLRETKTVLLRKIQDVDTQEKAALREIGRAHV